MVCNKFTEADYHSPAGNIVLAFDGGVLVGLRFEDRNSSRSECRGAGMLKVVRNWLDDYFCGKAPGVENIKYRLTGTPFQQTVWAELAKIPYGSTATYGDIARSTAVRMGCRQMSAQAVGNALAKNPIAIIVPCHRVAGADGSLRGYAWGLDKKKFLLDLERK